MHTQKENKSNGRSTTPLGADKLQRKKQCFLFNHVTFNKMKKFNVFSVKSIATLSNKELSLICGGSNERYHTECTMKNIGSKCISNDRYGICDYTQTLDSSGKVLYYDTFCKV